MSQEEREKALVQKIRRVVLDHLEENASEYENDCHASEEARLAAYQAFSDINQWVQDWMAEQPYEQDTNPHKFLEAAREILIPRLKSTFANLAALTFPDPPPPIWTENAEEPYFLALESLEQLVSEEFEKFTTEYRSADRHPDAGKEKQS